MNFLTKNNCIILFVILVSYSKLFGCVCENFNFTPNIEEKHLKNLDFITGEVLYTKTIRKRKTKRNRIAHDVTKVRIKIFKNFSNKKRRITIWTASNHLACGFHFKKKNKYLVALAKEKNKYKTSICLPTKELSQADEDLSFLEKKITIKYTFNL